ncbi:cytochrome P450 [Westerdykella ornata]|uniref:Cytochrome P450 n=1 Tax=Westerdykella ornata TaxID=318751 RepID=A0A6A6JUT2_WESOR|nr:cytochrome P450 [Westerdykella ornata]KAF2279506.1 cytochrome P450 [Westerdykella ornata]
MLLSLLGLVVLFYVLWTLHDLFRNYRIARTIAFPIEILPVDFLNVPFQVLEPHIWPILDFLRIPLPRQLRYLRRGWHYKAKANFHHELGPSYALVTPRQVYVHTCDAEAIHYVFSHRKEFPRTPEQYEVLAVYGPSLSTAQPEDWARHRKAVAPSFMNETIMRNVWEESIRQVRQMIDIWINDGVSSVERDTRTLSLNVLAAIGFRQSFDFRSTSEESMEPDGKFSYRDALKIVLDNVILIMLIPRKHLRYSWLPASLQRIGKAAADFGVHMQEMVNKELAKLNSGDKGSGTLVTSFVQAIDAHQKDKSKGISVDELLGNLFIINFAGHDTTANTLAFAMLLLAAYPEVQDWVGEEMMRETGHLADDELDYSIFAKLLRCRAVMYETLRLYPPVMSLPKQTLKPQILHTSNGPVRIPPDVSINSQVLAVQTHPKYWPDEPLKWKPTRWIIPKKPAGEGKLPAEDFFTPATDTYFPWSDGPQNCPGLKFSQVEFVAVLLYLLRKHRIHGIKNPNESDLELQKRILSVVEDCTAVMLLKMRDPDRVKVGLRPVS